jgi:hypothetical protein
MPQVVGTCDIPLTQLTKHSHRRHVRKRKSFIPQVQESSCLKAHDRQMFVLPPDPSLKIPFRALGRDSIPPAMRRLNFLLSRKAASRKAWGVTRAGNSTKIKER